MGLINGLVLIVLGGLCLPGMVAKKSPKAQEILNKIVPIQGTLGLVLFVWGIWGLIMSLLSLGLLGSWPLSWVTTAVGNLLSLGGGAILGWGMIQKRLLAKAPAEVKEKAEAAYAKLTAFQEKLGFACLFFGAWVILYSLLLRGMLNI